jgi:hypothetical protein
MQATGLEGSDHLHRARSGSAVRPSARAFREDRGRTRRRLGLLLFVAGLCGYGMLRIWMSTEVAACGSRVSFLERENRKLSTDLTVARAMLDQRRMYGAVMIPAEKLGFGTQGERLVLHVMQSRPAPPPPPLWAQMGTELRATSRLILSEALAQDRRAGGRSRGAKH